MMKSFSNIQTFLENVPPKKVIDDNLKDLLTFAGLSKKGRIFFISSLLTQLSTGIYPRWKHYIFSYQHQKYPFEVLSDWNLQKHDLDILKNWEKRGNYALLRTLKMASSKYLSLIDPHVIIGNSSFDSLYPIITFFENKDSEKVIDYARNLVMNKEDYYHLFEFEEISSIDNYELYCIYKILEEALNESLIYPLLLFPKECLKELSRLDGNSYLTQKFDRVGINYRNYSLFGDYCDDMFFDSLDTEDTKYDNLRIQIDNFTKERDKTKKQVSVSEVIDGLPVYQIQKTKVGCVSDFFTPESKIIDLLHSDKRYRKCHDSSQHIGKVFTDISENIYIVGGKVSANDKEYYYHSWVELFIDGECYVLDCNHNLWIKRKDYYKIYEAIPISKTKVSDMKEIVQTVILDAVFHSLNSMDLNYFGKEFQDCVKKNEKIVSKKAH